MTPISAQVWRASPDPPLPTSGDCSVGMAALTSEDRARGAVRPFRRKLLPKKGSLFFKTKFPPRPRLTQEPAWIYDAGASSGVKKNKALKTVENR